MDVPLPVRLSIGGSSEVLGEVNLLTVELDIAPSDLWRHDVRGELADLLDAAAARLRTPTA